MYKRGFVIFGVVSLTMGNSPLPFAYRLIGNKQALRQLFLRHSALPPQPGHKGAESCLVNLVHSVSSFGPILGGGARSCQPTSGRIQRPQGPAAVLRLRFLPQPHHVDGVMHVDGHGCLLYTSDAADEL